MRQLNYAFFHIIRLRIVVFHLSIETHDIGDSLLDGCIVWNAHNTVLGEEALLIYIVPVCYVKTGRYGNT